MRVRLDLETYCRLNVKDVGAYRYSEDPTFQIIMCAWSIGDEPVFVEENAEENALLMRSLLCDEDVVFVSHNAQFERICFSRLLGMPTGSYLDPQNWHDTASMAAERGYPRSLENAALALGSTEEKDPAGRALIRLFCQPNRKGERVMPEDAPEKWEQFRQYCAQDVRTLIQIDDILGNWPTPMEREIWLADQRINDLGMQIDVPLARKAIIAAEQNDQAQRAEVTALTGVVNPNSQPQMMKWLKESGLRIGNLQAETVRKFLDGNQLNPTQRRVLEIRQELSLTSSTKYATALNTVSPDDCIRGSFLFHGAHTGRWTGHRVQPHNLPREHFVMPDGEWDENAEKAAILDLMMDNGAGSLDLKRLVRALFLGPFTIFDLSQIEARIIAWLAGEGWALDAFERGRDIYVETAARMSEGGSQQFNRAHGKIAVLALGFGGSVESMRGMGHKGREIELKRIVNQWRKANPNIVRLWGELDRAISRGGRVGRLMLRRNGTTLEMRLPSGRSLYYHNMRRKNGSWVYDNPKKPGLSIYTWGGKIAENATQAAARDVLAESMVRLINHGYPVVGHIHDEGIVRGIHSVEDIIKIVCENPSWARGLPIGAKGFVSERYRKD